MSNYNRNKLLFNTLLNNKYKIKNISNNTLNIIIDNSKILCKYILLLTIIDNTILWSNDNPFNDIYTKNKINIIRNNIEKNLNINTKKINNNDILNIINYLLKSEDNNDWILTNKKNNKIEYYIITEIIYY
jgi:hypothetical protein